MHKTLSLLAALALLLPLASCSDGDIEESDLSLGATPSISFGGKVLPPSDDDVGHVNSFDTYGMLVPSFTPQDLLSHGFDYSDYLDVQIGDKIKLHNVPFVTGFNEVGVLENFFCDYNKLNRVYGFGQLHGNFEERIGGNVGDTIIVTLSESHGYYTQWNVLKSVYYYDKDEYYPDETLEEFANFREVTTTGMGKGVLCRSSNPLNPKDNKVRYALVDNMAISHGIKTEIDLADTKADIITYASDTAYTKYNIASEYCFTELYIKGNTIALGLTADTFGETFMKKLGKGLKFMLDHEPPYLLHCNEGKDRCGFVSMLLEALAGATYEEVAADYMKTLMNFYKIEEGSDSYILRQKLSIDRLVWLLEYVNTVEDFGNIDWTGKSPQDVDLQMAAETYIKACGLTSEECTRLKKILQTPVAQ